MWSLDFALVKRGEKEPLAETSSSMLYSRSVNLEIDLDAGEYMVYVSLSTHNLVSNSKCVRFGWIALFSKTQ